MARGNVAAALAIIALLIGGAAFIFAARPDVVSQPEVAATCASGQVAQNETLPGAFQCVGPFNAAFTLGTHSCATSSTASNLQQGFKLNFTAQATTAFVTVNWAVTPPGTANIYTLYFIDHGTGAAPNCGDSFAGGDVGHQFQLGAPTTSTVQIPGDESVVFTGLTIGTTYWVDLCITDSTTATWTYLTPQLSVSY